MVAGDVVNTAVAAAVAGAGERDRRGREDYLGTRDVIGYERGGGDRGQGQGRPVKAWIATRALTPAGERPTREPGRPRARS